MRRRRILAAGAVLAALFVTVHTSAHAADIIEDWGKVQPPSAPALKPITVVAKTTAFLLLDFLPPPYCSENPRCLATLPAMQELLSKARERAATVIYSLAGKYGISDVLKDVAPLGTEPIVKSHADKFVHTDLERILTEKGIKTVIVAGMAANGAVLYTASGAGLRDLAVVVPVDGMSSKDLYAEQLTAWHLAHAPGFARQVTLTRSDMITMQ